MQELYQWIEENSLKVNFTDQTIFEIEGVGKFLYLLSHDCPVFNSSFQFSLSDEEIQKASLVEYFAFSFGGSLYYSPKDKVQLTSLRFLGHCNLESQEDYPYLGIHGRSELLNGTSEYSDWVKKAKFLGISTLGICEKNTLAGVLEFQLSCIKKNIKSIIGITVVVQDKDRHYQVKLFCKNQISWKYLLLINKEINVINKGFITQERLFELSKQLICVVKFSYSDDLLIKKYLKIFKEDLYFQISSTIWTYDEIDKRELLILKDYYTYYLDLIPPLLLEDTYYLDRGDFIIKQKLNQISNITEPISEDQYFKSLEDSAINFYELSKNSDFFEKAFLRSVENTKIVSELCTFKIELGVAKLPEFSSKHLDSSLSQFSSNEDLFLYLVEKGIEEKLVDKVDNLEEYLDRVEREIQVIQYGGFIDYFLILWDVQSFCKQNDILTGLGRGSAGGSLISYLLDIVRVDPIKYGLLFERFLNIGRIGKIEDQEMIQIYTDSTEILSVPPSTEFLIVRNRKEIVVRSCDLIEDDLILEW